MTRNRPTTSPPMPRAGYSLPAVLVYVLLHAGCLGVFFVGVSARALAIFAAAFLLRAVAVSIVHHRYLAHRAYRTSRFMQFVLAAFGSAFVMGGPLWWADTHRRHHRLTDTPRDLHSPTFQGIVYAHCGWFLTHRHRAIEWDNVRDLARFPELVFLERWDVPIKLAGIAVFYAAFGWTGVVWGFFLPTTIVLHMVHWIQSVSHSIGGYRRYPTPDNSRNHWLFGLISLGEGYHHNHHCFPYSARIGMRAWEPDIGYALLRALRAVGLVWDLREPSKEARRGIGPSLDRHVAAAARDIRALGSHVDAVLASARDLPDPGDAQLAATRRHARATAEAIEGRAGTLLIEGPSALFGALDHWRSSVRRETALAVDTWPGRAELARELERVFVDHWPATAYEAWTPRGDRRRRVPDAQARMRNDAHIEAA